MTRNETLTNEIRKLAEAAKVAHRTLFDLEERQLAGEGGPDVEAEQEVARHTFGVAWAAQQAANLYAEQFGFALGQEELDAIHRFDDEAE